MHYINLLLTLTQCVDVLNIERRIACEFLFVVAVWSAVNVAGTRLQDLHPDIGKVNDPENWEQVHKDVINR